MSATIEQQIAAVATEGFAAQRYAEAARDMYPAAPDETLAEVYRKVAALRAAAETLKRTKWQPIETAPTNRPITLAVQFYDGSGQRVIPHCDYLGCPYTQPADDGTLDVFGEFATHWCESAEMPPVVPAQDAET